MVLVESVVNKGLSTKALAVPDLEGPVLLTHTDTEESQEEPSNKSLKLLGESVLCLCPEKKEYIFLTFSLLITKSLLQLRGGLYNKIIGSLANRIVFNFRVFQFALYSFSLYKLEASKETKANSLLPCNNLSNPELLPIDETLNDTF